jgi:hypothetical protein
VAADAPPDNYEERHGAGQGRRADGRGRGQQARYGRRVGRGPPDTAACRSTDELSDAVADFHFPDDLWARVFYDLLVSASFGELPTERLVAAFVPIYFGRVGRFVIENRRSPTSRPRSGRAPGPRVRAAQAVSGRALARGRRPSRGRVADRSPTGRRGSCGRGSRVEATAGGPAMATRARRPRKAAAVPDPDPGRQPADRRGAGTGRRRVDGPQDGSLTVLGIVEVPRERRSARERRAPVRPAGCCSGSSTTRRTASRSTRSSGSGGAPPKASSRRRPSWTPT